ncbi:MAG: polysaccharide deacetylase family protein [Alsobacter sp.]
MTPRPSPVAAPGPRALSRRAILAAPALLLATAEEGKAAACGVAPLGTARTLRVGTQGGLFVGLKSYPATLPFQAGEVALTFDDGPWPGTTPRILDALACEGAKATFFMIGRNAAANAAIARRVLAEGHTVACHSWSHPNMRTLSPEAGRRDIEHGFRAIADTLGREPAPFFRFPFFSETQALEQWLASRDIGVFGADFWASDWNAMTPQAELALVDGRLAKAGRGIVLFHDTKAQTAAMMPGFLRNLAAAGRSVVALAPGSGRGETVAAGPGWTRGVP